jgi:hypothetical protein
MAVYREFPLSIFIYSNLLVNKIQKVSKFVIRL